MSTTTYEWDAFGRLRKIYHRGNSNLVAEYRYNGLGYRIGIHEETSGGAPVDGNDLWYYHAFDEDWRWVATFRESDSSPKEEFLPHAAGFDGDAAGSYIDFVVLRNKDANTAWTSASDGTLEERLYYCHNWRADVVALVEATDDQVEQVRYSAYGAPFGLPAGDCDSDGDCDSADQSQHNTWTTPPGSYDVRGDLDLDGDLDSSDYAALPTGNTLARGNLSRQAIANVRGYGGYALFVEGYHTRYRVFESLLGRWHSRDADEDNQMFLYEYVVSAPLSYLDPYGLCEDDWPKSGCGRSCFGHGSYCGAGNNGGPPKTETDKCCRKHDWCFKGVGSVTRPCKRQGLKRLWCDREFCKCLRRAPRKSKYEDLFNSGARKIFCRCKAEMKIWIPTDFVPPDTWITPEWYGYHEPPTGPPTGGGPPGGPTPSPIGGPFTPSPGSGKSGRMWLVPLPPQKYWRLQAIQLPSPRSVRSKGRIQEPLPRLPSTHRACEQRAT